MQSTTQSSTASGYDGSQTGMDRLATLYTKGQGTLLVRAGNNINLTAAQVSSGGDVQMAAGNNLTLSTITTSRSDNVNAGNADNHFLSSSSKEVGTTIQSAGNTTLTAGNTLSATAATVNATGDLNVNANNILLLAGQRKASSDSVITNSSSDMFSSTKTVTKESHASAQAQVSTLSGNNITVAANKDLVSVGTAFNGQTSTDVGGQNNTLLYAAQNVSQSTTTETKTTAGLGLSVFNEVLDNKTTTDSKLQTTSIGTRLIGTDRVQIGVGNKTELQGAEVQTKDISFVKNNANGAGELILSGSTDTTQTSHTEKDVTAGVWQSQSGSGSTVQTLNQTTLKGNVTFDNTLKITVQIPKDVQPTSSGQALQSQITALGQSALGQTLASSPSGLAYLEQLKTNPNVQWDKVALAHENWHYDQSGLTGAGAAILTMVVAYFTAGAGSAALGSVTAAEGATAAAGAASVTSVAGMTLATTTAAGAVTYTAAGLAMNAAFTTLASQAAVVMANNGGDVGKTLEQLGSEQSVKNLLTTMATAGALQSLDKALGFTDSTQTVTGQAGDGSLLNSTSGIATSQAANAFQQNLLKNITNNVAGAAISSAINGQAFDEKSLTTALSSALVTAGVTQGANSIGSAQRAGNIDALTAYIAHAVVGCVGGAASAGNGSGCGAGAVGGVVGEAVANYALNQGMSDSSTVALAKTLSAVAGVLVGGGGDNVAAVNIAATMGANAAENNATLHKSQQQVLAQLQKSQTPAQQQALADAACYLQHCAVGLDPNDPATAAKVMSAYRGQSLVNEQAALKTTGFASYSAVDALTDGGNVATNALKTGANAVGGFIADQASSVVSGAKNLGNIIANDYANALNQGTTPQYPPGDLPSGGNGPTTPTAGAVVTTGALVPVCIPPVCTVVPVAGSTIASTGLTYSQGSGDGGQSSSSSGANGNPNSAQAGATPAGANGGAGAEANAGFDTANLQSKLEGYLLDPSHPQNQMKATWFQQALGFDKSNWQQLGSQITFDESKAIATKITQYGQTFEQVIPITGVNGRTIDVPFVFMKDNTGTVRLVTGIPAKK